MIHRPTVFVVDDDQAVRDSLRWLIESVGLPVETYAAAQDFLAEYDPNRPGCLVVDIRMPGMSGLELQQRLAAHGTGPAVIVITAHGDVATAVRAMRGGAVDLIEKPFNDQTLIDRIHEAIERDALQRAVRAQQAATAERLKQLTPRELEVLRLVVAGRPNKVIATHLGISEKTVEVHRGRVMDKMHVRSLPELVRVYFGHDVNDARDLDPNHPL